MIKRVSLKDIANELNLTVNTVSRALHDKDDISEKTKEKVRQVADDLGYIPDIIASSMRTSSTKTIAVLFDNLLNPYFVLMANYIQKHLIEKGYRMMIFTNTSTEAILTTEVYKQMLSHRVDGVISFLRPTKEVAKYANSIHLPIFVVGREADDLGIDSVFTDDVSGGYIMGQYFHNKAYQKIGYLGGPNTIMCNVKRAEGLQKYCDEHHIPCVITYSKWDETSTNENIDELLKNGVDAIFCFNDSIAYSAMLYIEKNHPNHSLVEITGYDNVATHLQLPIKLTTIGTDVEKMILLSIEQLMKRIEDFHVPLYVESVPVYLVQ